MPQNDDSIHHFTERFKPLTQLNDQQELTKNDLSHEANYKLSKIEQDNLEMIPKKTNSFLDIENTNVKSKNSDNNQAYFTNDNIILSNEPIFENEVYTNNLRSWPKNRQKRSIPHDKRTMLRLYNVPAAVLKKKNTEDYYDQMPYTRNCTKNPQIENSDAADDDWILHRKEKITTKATPNPMQINRKEHQLNSSKLGYESSSNSNIISGSSINIKVEVSQNISSKTPQRTLRNTSATRQKRNYENVINEKM